MKCPTCSDVSLVMTERQGVEIDYCPTCRGVWLDRGELDKLIERASAAEPARASTAQAPGQARSQPDFVDSDRYVRSGHDSGHYPRRKKSWMSEIFD